MLIKPDVCMLSSGDIVTELETKLLKMVEELCVTPDCHVQLALCKTALSVCEGFLQNQAFLFLCVYKMFVGHLNQDPAADLTDVCITKTNVSRP